MPVSTSLSLDRLRRDGQAFMEEITREYYLSTAGLKPTAELQPLYERYAPIFSPDALAMLVETYRGATPGSEDQRQARMLLEWLTDSLAGRELAPLEEREIAWEASAMITLSDGSRMQFERAPIEMANSQDRAKRLDIEKAKSTLVQAELAPLRQERFQRERDIVEALDLADGYNATWELLTGISLSELRGQCEQFLRDTQPIWDDTYPEFVKRVLDIDPRDARRSDALALFRAREFDDAFPAREMEPQVQRQVRDMGVDPLASGRVRVDAGEREGKRSRAFCAPVRIPEEVYLVLRPHGGQTDWSTYLHELGHALHFAYMRPDYPFEYRWLGDNSVTESYAMLFDHHMDDAGWLKRYTQLGDAKVRGFQRNAGFEELHYLRRYCAKFVYETHLYGGEPGWGSLPDLYVDLLTRATNFQYAKAEAFVDVDPRYYSARYLRAWQLQALLRETLTERYDEDWWRNPRAGPWLVQSLFSEGQRELAHEQAKRVSGRELSFAPLVRSVEKLLS
ncbi:MAG TPA: hypothetical protein VJ867_18060 [Gemmatimonadaceae bacterium]|nr:hypothetical protein [Gemmatimonadaceae bacterium]